MTRAQSMLSALAASITLVMVGCSEGDSASGTPVNRDTATIAGGGEAGSASAPQGMFTVPLTDLAGNRTDLAAYSGRPMLIEVWATWCGPCRRVRSIIKANRSELASVATVVGLSVDEGGAPTVQAYLRKSPSPGMIEYLVTPQFRAAIAPYDTSNTIPKLVYVTPDGRIVNVSYGVNSAGFMIGLLRNLRGNLSKSMVSTFRLL